jgi:hypothetical protein
VGASNNERKKFLIGIVMADRNTIPLISIITLRLERQTMIGCLSSGLRLIRDH